MRVVPLQTRFIAEFVGFTRFAWGVLSRRGVLCKDIVLIKHGVKMEPHFNAYIA